jgi:hypothetical protein
MNHPAQGTAGQLLVMGGQKIIHFGPDSSFHNMGRLSQEHIFKIIMFAQSSGFHHCGLLEGGSVKSRPASEPQRSSPDISSEAKYNIPANFYFLILLFQKIKILTNILPIPGGRPVQPGPAAGKMVPASPARIFQHIFNSFYLLML